MRIHFFIIILVLLIGCKSVPELSEWQGEYSYEEELVEAVAGYSMIMQWEVSISEENGEYVGVLEVNGQQTSMKLKTSIEGNSTQVSVKFKQGLEGIGYEQFKPGDELFRLEKNSEGNIVTFWQKLEPGLSEKYENGKVYFVKMKKG